MVGVSLGIGGYGYLHWTIQSSLDKHSLMAQKAHPHAGDEVSALIAYVESESHSLRQRNLAVWALGQLPDSRALPVLERFCTGQPCNHDKFLCQRELTRAISLCKGEIPNVLLIGAGRRFE
jgi:hypothetical protein